MCRSHGGAAPQVKAKADERLKELERIAIDVLGELLGSDQPPPIRLGAAKEVFVLNGTGRAAGLPPGTMTFTLRIGDHADGDA